MFVRKQLYFITDKGISRRISLSFTQGFVERHCTKQYLNRQNKGIENNSMPKRTWTVAYSLLPY